MAKKKAKEESAMRGRIEAVVDRLLSVKVWAAVAGIVLAAIYGQDLDPELQAGVIAGIPTILIVIQGFIDAINGQRPVK